MIIGKDIVLKDLLGRPIVSGEDELKLDVACRVALERCGVDVNSGRPADFKTQKARQEAARRIVKGENLTDEEAAEVRNCVAFFYASPVITGAVADQLSRLQREADEAEKARREAAAASDAPENPAEE